MTDEQDHEEWREDPPADPLGSPDAARFLTRLTGMTLDSARTYAGFHSGRWATGPAGAPSA